MLSRTGLVRLCLLVASAEASQHAAVKRQSSELLDSYDFVVAGGGTAGLTVADRLSEAFPQSKLRMCANCCEDANFARRIRPCH